MNTFGEFLYTLRKEKGMTQAELADILKVTNKAVSKWETGEAMPETAQLLPIAQIFGVTVDELLKGERNANTDGGEIHDDIKDHVFTRGNDSDLPKPLSERICGAVCGVLMFIGITVYLLLGTLASHWTPYWVIIPECALACGVIGCIFDLFNPVKRSKKKERGENPYTGCICGVIVLVSIMAYLLASVLTGLWHPLWIIVVVGVLICVIVGITGDAFAGRKK